MLLTASTLGAPTEDLDTVIGWLASTGVTGLELRVSSGQIADPAMTRAQRRELRARLEDAGITLTGLASYVRVASDTSDEMVIGALVAALDLAADLGAPMVRVFPGAPVRPGPYNQLPELIEPTELVDARAVRRLNAVAGYANEVGAHPVLETHDSHPRGADVARILAQVDGPVGAVWDLMHPWRVGENLSETWWHLSDWLLQGRGSVQVKDAALPEQPLPLPIGQGTLPVDDFAQLLLDEEYEGVVCLEWEKAWHAEAATLDVALASAAQWFNAHDLGSANR